MSGRRAAAWAGSWRSALRISGREVRRHRARSLLIVAMLALPVLATVAADTIVASAENLTVAEQLNRTVGGFDALAEPAGSGPVYQSSTDVQPRSLAVDPGAQSGEDSGYTSDYSSDYTAFAAGVAERIRTALPQAVVVTASSAGGVFAHGPSGYATVEYLQTALTDPGFRGILDVTAGRLAAAADEVDLSPVAASALGVHVGDRLTLPGSSLKDGRAATVTVVGLVRRPGSTKSAELFAPVAAPTATGAADFAWFVRQSGGVSWNQVRQLNKLGIVATSRAVFRDPPPASQVPYDAAANRQALEASAQRVSVAEATVGAITVGIALLEVVLLAGPAFAVSARRREREYAVLGAAGADAADLRRIVLADGVVLGAVAGVCGVGLGIGLAAAVLPLAPLYNGVLSGALHVSVLHAAGVAVLAVVLGLCSAYVPARAVARRDITAGLAGRREAVTRRTRRSRIALGLLLAAAGLCGVFLARHVPGVGGPGVSVVGGVALVEIGGILCTPAIVAGVARLGRLLPLGPRLALRDSARHPGRTTPAVAAMFAAVAGAVAAGGWLDSSLAQERAAYRPSLLANQVAVTGLADAKQGTQVAAALRAVMPITGSVLTSSVAADPGPKGTTGSWTLTLGPQIETLSNGVAALGCQGDSLAVDFGSDGAVEGGCGGDPNLGVVQYLVGDAQTLRTVTGLDDARAGTVLAQGGVVEFTQAPQAGDTVQVSAQYLYTTDSDPKTSKLSTKTLTVPVDYVTAADFPNPSFVLAPATAHALGMDGTAATRSLFANLGARATADQMYAGNQALSRLGVESQLEQETGLQTKLGLANLIVLFAAMLVAIGAAAIATGLALADGRRDQETISAVGGSPGTRRRLAGSTALVVTGLGVGIGVPVGLVLAAGLVGVVGGGGVFLQFGGFDPETPLRFTVPWLDLGALALAVPLLTALGAAALSRSRAPGSGRVAD